MPSIVSGAAATGIGVNTFAQTSTFTSSGPFSSTGFATAFVAAQSPSGQPVGASAVTYGLPSGGNFNTSVTMGNTSGFSGGGGWSSSSGNTVVGGIPDTAISHSNTWASSFSIF